MFSIKCINYTYITKSSYLPPYNTWHVPFLGKIMKYRGRRHGRGRRTHADAVSVYTHRHNHTCIHSSTHSINNYAHKHNYVTTTWWHNNYDKELWEKGEVIREHRGVYTCTGSKKVKGGGGHLYMHMQNTHPPTHSINYTHKHTHTTQYGMAIMTTS